MAGVAGAQLEASPATKRPLKSWPGWPRWPAGVACLHLATEGRYLPPSPPPALRPATQNGRVTGGVSLVLSGDSTGVVPAGVNPGDVYLVSGGGGSVRLTSGSSTNSSAGTFLINPGDAATAGSVTVQSGASNASVAGSLTLQTADAAQGTGGVVNVVSGAGISGGSVVITAGTSLAGTDGGSALHAEAMLGPGTVVQSGGEGSTSPGFRRRLLSAAPPPPSPYADNSGGNLVLSAGAAHSARGGGVAITAGRSLSGSGGSVVIAPGAAPNASGTVRLQDAEVSFPPSLLLAPPAYHFTPSPFHRWRCATFLTLPSRPPPVSLSPPPPCRPLQGADRVVVTSLSNLELSGAQTIDILAPKINLLGDVTALAGFQLLNGIIVSNGAFFFI